MYGIRKDMHVVFGAAGALGARNCSRSSSTKKYIMYIQLSLLAVDALRFVSEFEACHDKNKNK